MEAIYIFLIKRLNIKLKIEELLKIFVLNIFLKYICIWNTLCENIKEIRLMQFFIQSWYHKCVIIYFNYEIINNFQ